MHWFQQWKLPFWEEKNPEIKGGSKTQRTRYCSLSGFSPVQQVSPLMLFPIEFPIRHSFTQCHLSFMLIHCSALGIIRSPHLNGNPFQREAILHQYWALQVPGCESKAKTLPVVREKVTELWARDWILICRWKAGGATPALYETAPLRDISGACSTPTHRWVKMCYRLF